MSRQDLETLSRLNIPDSDSFVERAGDNHVGLRIKVDTESIVGVSRQGFDEGPSFDVPEAEGLVVGGRDEVFGVGGEG